MQFAPRLTNGTQPIALNGLSRVGRAVDLPMDAKPSVQLVRNGTATVRILRLVFLQKIPISHSPGGEGVDSTSMRPVSE